MALAMTPVTIPRIQDDAMDIDIDMNVEDMGPAADDEILEEGEEISLEPTGHQPTTGEVAAIYLEDPAQEPQWEKVHIRGVDDLSTDNIRTFASDYYPNAGPYVQWVDDHSANLVYKDKSIARQAILTFTQQPVTEQEILENPFEMRTARPLVTNPSSMLTVRIAMMGDRKKKNAKDSSRYYLMHPEADPAERMRREKNVRGDSGDYKRRRFDDRENRRRQRHQDDNADTTNDFEASMYDDAPAAEKPNKERGRDLFSRISKPRNRSASPVANSDAISLSDSDRDNQSRRKRNGYRNRDSPPPRNRNNTGRELFDPRDDTSSSRRGMRSDNPDLFARREKQSVTPANTSYEVNPGVARQLRADLKAAQNQSPARSHRRSRAVDHSRVEEDLAERFARKSISLDSTKSVTQKTANTGKELFSSDRDTNMNGNGNGAGFSIKGSASQGMSIKGRADNVKELFPDRFSSGNSGGRGNAGKELFDQPVRARPTRQRAGDLFD